MYTFSLKQTRERKVSRGKHGHGEEIPCFKIGTLHFMVDWKKEPVDRRDEGGVGYPRWQYYINWKVLEAVRLGLGRRDLSRSNLHTAFLLSFARPCKRCRDPHNSSKEIYTHLHAITGDLNRYLTITGKTNLYSKLVRIISETIQSLENNTSGRETAERAQCDFLSQAGKPCTWKDAGL